jgi:sulfate transport system substrate-binding protein
MKKININILKAVIINTLFISNIYAEKSLLNVSYDPTREFYQEINSAFSAHWLSKEGDKISIKTSHGGSGKQARSVIDGLDADVVTLALAYDIDAISEKSTLLPVDWQKRLPNNSTPYTSTVVFMVRKGNPKNIKDWDDLIREKVSVITPNPKTSGGAKWNYLAAWGYALKKYGSDEKAKEFISKLFRNVSVLDAGARASTTTFAQRGIGDVLIVWENEALLSVKKLGDEKLEIIVPSISILAEPPVAIIDKNVNRHGTQIIAKAYLEFLYTPEGQEIAVKNFYRPRIQDLVTKYKSIFPLIELFTIDGTFGGWEKAQNLHFSDGGIFEQIFQEGK